MLQHALKECLQKQPGLITNCFLKRNSPQEILITKDNKKFGDLNSNSVIGTSSFRREFQLMRIRDDLKYKTIRGNVDTRISKLNKNEYDGIILSKAGIDTLELNHLISEEFSTEKIIPSAGQGIVSLQCRKDNDDIINLLNKINDKIASIAALSERKVLSILEGDCHTAVGVFSKVYNDEFEIMGELFSIDGKKDILKKLKINPRIF